MTAGNADDDLAFDRAAYPPSRVIRSSNKWRTLRNRFKAHCQRTGARCLSCTLRGDIENAVIDYTAAPTSPWAFEADHIQPVDERPDLAYEWSNLAPSHSRCNRQKGVRSYERQGEWTIPDW